MKKRVLALCLAVVTVFTVIAALTACGDEPAQTTPQPTVTTTVKPSAGTTTNKPTPADVTTTTKKADEPEKPTGVLTIGTKEELLAFMKAGKDKTNTYAGQTVKLTANIDLNDTKDLADGKPWYQGENLTKWEPIDATFQGTFDGAGYVIKGLYIEANHDTDGTWTAMFRSAQGATFQNLAIVDAYVHVTVSDEVFANEKGQSNSRVAVIVANGSPLNFQSCYVDAFMDCDRIRNMGYLAGWVQSGLTMENCYTSGKMIGFTCGALFSGTCGGTIKHCFSTVEITSSATSRQAERTLTAWCGGTVNMSETYAQSGQFETDALHHSGVTATGCGFLTVDQMKGETAKEAMKGFDFTDIWQINDGAAPSLKIFGNNEDCIVTPTAKSAE